jgi:hypothetical protein
LFAGYAGHEEPDRQERQTAKEHEGPDTQEAADDLDVKEHSREAEQYSCLTERYSELARDPGGDEAGEWERRDFDPPEDAALAQYHEGVGEASYRALHDAHCQDARHQIVDVA